MFSLLIILAVLGVAAHTQEVSTCSVSGTSNYVVSKTGGIYVWTDCHLADQLSVVCIDLSEDNPTEITFSNGSVTVGLDFSGPLMANTVKHLHITVANMAFGADASLSFSNALPSASMLLIFNNSFVVTPTNAYPSAIKLLFGESFELSNNTMATISHNTLTASAENGYLYLIDVSNSAQLIISNNSTFSIINNRISNSRSALGASIAYLTAKDSILREGSAMLVQGNHINNISASGSVCVLSWFSSGGNTSFDVTIHSQILVQNNRLGNVTLSSGHAAVVWIRADYGRDSVMTLTDGSTFEGSDNKITTASAPDRAVVIFIESGGGGYFLIRNFSRLVFDRNCISNIYTSVCNLLHLAHTTLSFIALQGSAISFSQNTAFSIKATQIHGVNLETSGRQQISISQNSSLAVSGNAVSTSESAAGSGITVIRLLFTQVSSFVVDENSMFMIRDNRLLRANAGVSAVVSFGSKGSTSSLSILVHSHSVFAQENNRLEDTISVDNAQGSLWYAFNGQINISATGYSNFSLSNHTIANVVGKGNSVVAVYLHAGTLNLLALDRSAIIFNNNGLSAVKSATLIGVYMETIASISESMLNSSFVSVDGNFIVNATASSSAFAVVMAPQNTWFIEVADRSERSYSHNHIVNSSIATEAFAVYIYSASSVVIVRNFAHFRMNENSLQELHGGLAGGAVTLYILAISELVALDITMGSTLTICNNFVKALNTEGMVSAITFRSNQFLDVNLNQHSTINATRNTIAHVNAGGSASLIWLRGGNNNFVIQNQSQLLFAHNSLHNVSSSASNVVAINWETLGLLSGITIQNNSTVTASSTTITDVSAPMSYGVVCGVQVSTARNFTVRSDSVFEVSNSSISGSLASSLVVFVATVVESWTVTDRARFILTGNSIIAGMCLLSEDIQSITNGFQTRTISIVQVASVSTPIVNDISELHISHNSVCTSFFVATVGIIRFLTKGSSRVSTPISINGGSALILAQNSMVGAADSSYLPGFVELHLAYASSVQVVNNTVIMKTTSALMNLRANFNQGTTDPSSLKIYGNTLTVIAAIASGCPPEAMQIQADAAADSILSTITVASNYITFTNTTDVQMVCAAISIISCRSISTFLVTHNQILSNVSSIISFGTLNMSTGGQLNFTDNNFHISISTASLINVGTLLLAQASLIALLRNKAWDTLGGASTPSDLSLMEVTEYYNPPDARIITCQNIFVANDESETAMEVYPLRMMEAMGSRCPLIGDASASATISNTATRTLYVDAIRVPPPVPVAVEVAKKLEGATGVVVAVTAVASAVGGQLGVANALMRLANCDEGGVDEALPILVHPLRFSFGSKESQKNAAGALSNTLLVPLIVAMIALGPVRLLIMRTRSVPSRRAMVQMGWPSLLVMPFSNLAEGIGVTTMKALSSGEPFGVGMGVISLLVLLAFLGSWVWILVKVIPRKQLTLRVEEKKRGSASDGLHRSSLRNPLWRVVRPSHRWVPLALIEGTERKLSAADVERYGNTVGDKQWYYAELLSFLCSVAVGVCESLPASLCRERVAIALIPAFCQCGLAVLALIPLERFLQSLLALCLVPMYIVVAVKAFSNVEDESDDVLDSAMAVFSSAGNVIGIIIMSFGLLAGAWEMATTHVGQRRSATRQPGMDNSQTSSHEPNPRLDIPLLSVEQEDLTPSTSQLTVALDQARTSTCRESEAETDEQLSDAPDTVPPFLPAATGIRAISNAAPAHVDRTVAEILDLVEREAIVRRLFHNSSTDL